MSPLPPISPTTLRFFTTIVRSYFRRHFRAVQIQNAQHLREAQSPLIVYANHTSWWDPMVSVLLAQTLLPGRKHYAPMDAAPLARYPILRKLGIFPVELNSARGAVQFLRTSEAILKSGGVLWVTPQGRFADPRELPLAFKPGLAALAQRVPEATLLPLAIEYTFWSERLPETLLRFGAPFLLTSHQNLSSRPERSEVERPPHLFSSGEAPTPSAPSPAVASPVRVGSTETINTQLEAALTAAMQALQTAAITRDPAQFEQLLEGARGTGGFYAMGRRMRALFTRGKFRKTTPPATNRPHSQRNHRSCRADAAHAAHPLLPLRSGSVRPLHREPQALRRAAARASRLALATPATPRIAVLIPARNEEANIEAVLRTVLASTQAHLEVIVLDDHSTDHTAAIVERIIAELSASLIQTKSLSSRPESSQLHREDGVERPPRLFFAGRVADPGTHTLTLIRSRELPPDGTASNTPARNSPPPPPRRTCSFSTPTSASTPRPSRACTPSNKPRKRNSSPVSRASSRSVFLSSSCFR